jgi:hypothetical protein
VRTFPSGTFQEGPMDAAHAIRPRRLLPPHRRIICSAAQKSGHVLADRNVPSGSLTIPCKCILVPFVCCQTGP